MSVFYFDSSALLSVLIREHETHERCKSLPRACLMEGTVATSATYAYAEIYRHLTQNIPPYNLLPEEVEVALVEHLGNLLEVIVLDRKDYEAAIRRCVRLQLSGPIVNDALHYQAALRAGAKTIITDNIKDFMRLVSEGETMNIQGLRNP